MTEWRDVPGFPNYRASDQGEVISLPRTTTPGGPLKPQLNHGYQHVSLRRDGRTFTRRVHQLVALAFLGPVPDGMEVRHLNGDPLDNRLANLKYGTSSDNKVDAVAHGTHAMARKTHCKRGHEFTLENTYAIPSGGRQCRACVRHRDREYRARKKLRTP